MKYKILKTQTKICKNRVNIFIFLICVFHFWFLIFNFVPYAAFGGFVLPFINNSNIPPFDFRLPGVSSITIDPHKMGLATIPSGVLLFRNPELLKKIQMAVGYLAGGESPQTLLGTRPGASAIAVWALLKHLGTDGYRKIVKNCMDLTHRFAQEIEKIPGLSLVTKPILNIVGIKSSVVSITDLSTDLRRKGWAVARFPNHIRIVIMPHISKKFKI